MCVCVCVCQPAPLALAHMSSRPSVCLSSPRSPPQISPGHDVLTSPGPHRWPPYVHAARRAGREHARADRAEECALCLPTCPSGVCCASEETTSDIICRNNNSSLLRNTQTGSLLSEMFSSHPQKLKTLFCLTWKKSAGQHDFNRMSNQVVCWKHDFFILLLLLRV